MLIDDADVKINEEKSRYSDEGNRPKHGSDVMKKLYFFSNDIDGDVDVIVLT